MSITVSWIGVIILFTVIGTIWLIVYLCIRRIKTAEIIYGIPLVPDDIVDLDTNFKIKKFQFVFSDFKPSFIDGNCVLIQRRYEQVDGVWTLEIEFKDGELVAYRSSFESKYSKWLRRGSIGSVGVTRYISPGGG